MRTPKDWRPVDIHIDRSTIENALGSMEIIDPVWWLASFYETPAMYEQSLARFTQAQRLVWAMHWYLAEVYNGGHDQFYSNSTGMVWADALSGFATVGFPDLEAILRESAVRLGGSPALDHSRRRAQVDELRADFDDLDQRLYTSREGGEFEDRIMDWIRQRPSEFVFDGIVRRPPSSKSSQGD